MKKDYLYIKAYKKINAMSNSIRRQRGESGGFFVFKQGGFSPLITTNLTTPLEDWVYVSLGRVLEIMATLPANPTSSQEQGV